MRAMVGQVFYFCRRPGVLPGTHRTSDRKWDKSDFLAAFSGQVWPACTLTLPAVRPGRSAFERYSLGALSAGAGQGAQCGLRYNVDAATPIKQVDFSGQWPINGRWQAVGRYNYSFLQIPADRDHRRAGVQRGLLGAAYGGPSYADNPGRFDDAVLRATRIDWSVERWLESLTVLQRRIPGYAVGQPATGPGLAEW
jgi:LPS-assembly protein